jgi:cbb3-type cytochrome oxidase subunit 3
LLAILQKYKFSKKEFIITFISIAISCILKIYNEIIGGVFDIWIGFGLPFVLLGKDFPKKWWHVFIAYAITFIFQLLSMLVKNLGVVNVSETYFIGLIYMIDVYIMCILYYLYRNYKKEKRNMGKLWMIFAGKPVDKLKEMKAKREKQVAKLNEEIKAIETEIAKQSDKK